MAIPPRKSTDLAPPARLRYLDGVVEYLWDSKNLRGLICLVERWSSVEPPSRVGRMFQVRAFLSLRLMDRAWLHLRKLMEDDPSDLQAAALATEMFLDRGWPSRARKVVTEAEERHPGDPIVASLKVLCDGPPRTPPANARELEQHGSAAQILDLAERFMATGSLLRARALLERIRNTDPTRTRAKDLLWALDGDFDVGDVRPEDLAAQLAPTFRDHVHIGATELEPPGADEVTATRIPLEDDDAHEAEFPALFRRIGLEMLPLHDDDTGEITQARALASPEDLRQAAPAETTGELDAVEPRREDTEVMMVIPKGGGEQAPPAEGPRHRRRVQDYDLRATLDLQGYRKHMGMAVPALSDLTTDADDTEDDAEPVSLEDEDADLVVVTKREQPARSAGPVASPRVGPMRVIEKHPVPEPEARPEVVPAAPQPPAPRPPPVAPPRVSAVRPPAPRPAPVHEPDEGGDDLELRPRGPRLGLLLLALVVLGGMLALGGWLVFHMLGLGPARAVAQASQAIAADRYDALLKVERTIEAHLPPEETDPEPAVMAAGARVQLALWSGHQPIPERFEEIHRLVDGALAAREPPAVAHLAAAELAAWEWRIEEAERQLEAYGAEDSDALLVRSSIAAARGDTAAAVERARSATVQDPGSERAWRTLAERALASGAADDARAALERARALDPDSPRVAVIALLLDHQGKPKTLPQDAQDLSIELNQRYTPPRIEAVLFEAVAASLPGGSRSEAGEWALQRAFSKDGTDPDLLAAVAVADIGEGHLIEAHKKLQKAVHFRPGDLSLRLAMVRLLLDLDRVEEARAQLQEARALRPEQPELALIAAWIEVVDALPWGGPEVFRQVSALLDPYIAAYGDEGEARWLLGLAMAGARHPQAPDTLYQAATLMDGRAPSDRLLIYRAMASLVFAGHRGADNLLDPLDEEAPQRDPWVHLFLAWEAGQGQRARASRELSAAVQVSPEHARALWERARFLDEVVHDSAGARAAYRSYLALNPSGSRARQARQRP
ncbi:MAG: tetratricopeptide repeat protein [Pseudomonadota bacterium]